MSDPSSETSDGNAVEECPAPPIYYKLFPSDKIAPPVIRHIPNSTAWSSAHQYNGTISAQMTNQNIADISSEDYKTEMQSALLGIMNSGLAIVTDGCSNQREYQVEVRLAPLNQAIQKMQSAMSAYQPHEARELLCFDMAKQVQRLKELKLEMTNLLKIENNSENVH